MTIVAAVACTGPVNVKVQYKRGVAKHGAFAEFN